MPSSYREPDERSADEVVFYSYERANAQAPRRRRRRALALLGTGLVAVALAALRGLEGTSELGIGFIAFNVGASLLAISLAAIAVFFESPPPGDDFVVQRVQTAGQCSRSRSSETGVAQSRSQ